MNRSPVCQPRSNLEEATTWNGDAAVRTNRAITVCPLELVVEEDASAEHVGGKGPPQQPALATGADRAAQIGKRRTLHLPVPQHLHEPRLLDDAEGEVRVWNERDWLRQPRRDDLCAKLR